MSELERLGAFARLWDNGPCHLPLLKLKDYQAAEVFRDLLDIVRASPGLEEDLHKLLVDADWRPQLVGAVVLALGVGDASHYDDVWVQIEADSWIVPQLAAVLSVVDKAFCVRAKTLIDKLIERGEGGKPSRFGDIPNTIGVVPPQSVATLSPSFEEEAKRHSAQGPAGALERRAKTIAALLALVNCKDLWIQDRMSRDNVKALLSADVDGGGDIAVRWKERLLQIVNDLRRTDGL